MKRAFAAPLAAPMFAGAFAATLAVAPLTTPALAQKGAAPVAANIHPDLKRVNDYIRAIDTMTADFVQTDRNGQVLNGQLTLKRPGRIRFQYQKGVPLLIVGDGKALTMIDYEVRQVQRWPIKNSPLGVLLDPDRDFSRYGKVIAGGNPNVFTVDARDPRHPEYGTISLIFTRKPGAPAGIELFGWVSLDAQNNRTSIRLSNHRYGVPVADTVFKWRDPRPTGPRAR